MKQFAIVAPTASGKTALSINLAHKLDAVILSLDSLAVYKQIDIASAKPTMVERDGIVHFGIDRVYPNEDFDVIEFIEEYERAKSYAEQNGKNLIIVGGTSFYLKAMIDGISKTPKISLKTKNMVDNALLNLEDSYKMLVQKDKNYMEKIASNDRYRIQKALEIYYETDIIPSEYFRQNPPTPIVNNLKLFQIETDKDILRDRISLRTKKMIDDGLIDEVIFLEQNYGRGYKSLGSIGIVESFDYLDGKVDKKQLHELISTHTAQLAKRQRTFNKSQFSNITSEKLTNLENKIISMI